MKATDFVKQGREEMLVTSLRDLQLKADMEALKAMLLAHPDIRLVIFDPITGFFGCDQNKDQELRPVMNRLKEVCEETGVTVIAVSHHNKKSDLDALKQILGASSFAAAARVVWMVSRDPDAKDTRHMTVAKLNIGKEQGGLQFGVQETVIHADREDITNLHHRVARRHRLHCRQPAG